MSRPTPFEAGRKAFIDNNGACPFYPGTRSEQEWIEGFCQAQTEAENASTVPPVVTPEMLTIAQTMLTDSRDYHETDRGTLVNFGDEVWLCVGESVSLNELDRIELVCCAPGDAKITQTLIDAARRLFVTGDYLAQTADGLVVNFNRDGVWLCKRGQHDCEGSIPQKVLLILAGDGSNFEEVRPTDEAATVRTGDATYAGSYRLAYTSDGARYLEVRKADGFGRINKPIPSHIRGAYAAAKWLGV